MCFTPGDRFIDKPTAISQRVMDLFASSESVNRRNFWFFALPANEEKITWVQY